jgi:hypothetical protein
MGVNLGSGVRAACNKGSKGGTSQLETSTAEHLQSESQEETLGMEFGGPETPLTINMLMPC